VGIDPVAMLHEEREIGHASQRVTFVGPHLGGRHHRKNRLGRIVREHGMTADEQQAADGRGETLHWDWFAFRIKTALAAHRRHQRLEQPHRRTFSENDTNLPNEQLP